MESAAGAGPPLLSLCLIVKNEEAMLPGCLVSARGLDAEVVVVDTGSSDNTVALARAAGARVSFFAWCDDFAAARNASLAAARGRHALLLDADERLGPGAAEVLRAAIADDDNNPIDCGLLPLHHAARVDAGADDVLSGRARIEQPVFLPRLFRRTPDLVFEGVIHESAARWILQPGRQVRALPAPIIHLGRTTDVIRDKDKQRRDIALLRKRLATDGPDILTMGYLALELWGAGVADEARAVVDQAWALLPSQRDRSAMRLAVARAVLQLAAADPAGVLETVAEAQVSEGIGSPDLRYLRAQAGEVLALRQPPGGERRRLLEAALADLQVASAPGTVTLIGSLVAGATSFAGLTRLGTVLLLLGRPTEAAAAFTTALVARPEHEEARLGRVEAALESGDIGNAWSLVKPLLGAGRDAWLLAAAIAHANRQDGSARTLLDRARAPGLPPYLALHRREREAALTAAILS